MKLFILKLLSLLVLFLGLISLAYNIGFAPLTDIIAQLPDKLVELQNNLPESVEQAKGVLEIKILWLITSIAAIVFGIYGFVPRSTKWRKPKKISYDGPHGLVQIQLDTVEESLNRVLARMPEVKKIDVKVEPRDGGRSALIKADTVLQHQAGQNARAIAGLVSDFIAETATKMLGLEELATIELNIIGINVNSRKSSKVIRKGSLSNSGNAPVELLEAAPKPIALAAPGEPLGSGPVEEELEEDPPTDPALDTNAVDSVVEESKQAAARSELLEPLSLHETTVATEEPAEETSEDATLEDSAPEQEKSVEESTHTPEESAPNLEVLSVDGDAANVQVVPEPLGDLVDDDPAELGGGVEVPEEEASTSVDAPADDSTTEAEEAVASTSPWAPLSTDAEAAVEMPDDFDSDASTTANDLGEPAAESTDLSGEGEEIPEASEAEDDASTDSIVGDLSTSENDVPSDEPSESENEVESEAVGEKAGEKKSWGWFS